MQLNAGRWVFVCLNVYEQINTIPAWVPFNGKTETENDRLEPVSLDLFQRQTMSCSGEMRS